MAGVIKVDRVQSDSNLAFNVAGANVAFMDASSFRTVSSNLVVAGTSIISNGKIVSSIQPSGSILQVVQTIVRSTWSVTSPGTTWTDISGMSANITPSSISSRIMVMFTVWSGTSNNTYGRGIRVVRDGSVILTSSATSTSEPRHTNSYLAYSASQTCDTNTLVDSPSSTSSLTYKLQFVHEGTGTTFSLNTPGSITNDGRSAGAVSTLTLMEIAG